MLVVIAIIAVLAGLLLPAVQKAREAANRTTCVNNLHQMGLALHTYHDQHKCFPNGGEGTSYGAGLAPNPPATRFDIHSVFTHLLPYVEQEEIYEQFNLAYAYNDPAWPQNQVAAQTPIPTYLCPSNPLRPSSGVDSSGYGYTDYGPTVYTDIDPVTGGRNKFTRMDGALRSTDYTGPGTDFPAPYNSPQIQANTLVGSRLGDIRDGLSKTIAIAEDVGRNEAMPGAYVDPIEAPTLRHFHRWAEPDNGFGVSGNPLSWNDQLTGTVNPGVPIQAINNNKLPFGGGACPWQTKTNCGPNDEIFSFHGSGANVVFMDGHVSFLDEKMNVVILRYLVTAAEGISPGNANY
jgi:prepilin-type processing-associated H-X9-DG protein